MPSSIHKTIKCIEALSQAPAGLTVAQVAAISGLSWQSASRLMDGLVADSIASKDRATKRYRLATRLYQWSTTAMQAMTPINIARKEMVKLCIETGRQVNFLVLDDLDILIVERCERIDGLVVNRPVPARRIWYETGSGKTIAAFSSAETSKSLLDRTYRTKGLNPPPRDGLRAELDEIRERGYAVTRDVYPDEDIVGLVAPILGLDGCAVAAIGTALPGPEMERAAGPGLVSQLRSTAGLISHYLGSDDEALAGIG